MFALFLDHFVPFFQAFFCINYDRTGRTDTMSLKISKNTWRLFGFCVFYLLYLFIGAAIFSAIEYSNEKDIIENLKAKRQEFFTKHRMCLNGKVQLSLS